MTKDPIDKLFKDKLANRKFAYRDAYWKKAASGIDKDDRENKTHLLRYLIIFVVGIGVTGFGWWLFNVNKQNEQLQESGEKAGEQVTLDYGNPQKSDAPVVSEERSETHYNDGEDAVLSLEKKDIRGRLEYSAGAQVPQKESSMPDHFEELLSAEKIVENESGNIQSENDDAALPVHSEITADGSLVVTNDETLTGRNEAGDSINELDHHHLADITVQPDSSIDNVNPSDAPLTSSATSEPILKQSFRWGLSCFGGVTLNSRKIRSQTEEGRMFANEREMHTTTKITPEAGILFSGYNKSWNISSGAVLSSYKEETNYSFNTIQFEFDTSYLNYLDSVIFRIIDTLGRRDTIWRFIQRDTFNLDTLSAKNVRDSAREALNGDVIYRYIEIPLLFGKEFQIGERATFYARSGVSLGILRSVTGYNLDPLTREMKPVRMQSFSKVFYFAMLGSGLSYEVFPSLSLYGEVFMKWNLTDILETPDYRERLSGYSLRLGLNYRF